MGDKEEWRKRRDAFWQRLQDAVERDNGIRTILKRNAGTQLCEAEGNATAAFYRIYGGGLVSEWKEDRCFFAVCVSCLWKPEDWKRAVSMVEGARKFLDSESKETFGKKMKVLMDLPWDRDGFLAGKLCRLLKFCQSKGIVVDGKELLEDLLSWDRDDRQIQRKWAREFYRMESDKGGNTNVD